MDRLRNVPRGHGAPPCAALTARAHADLRVSETSRGNRPTVQSSSRPTVQVPPESDSRRCRTSSQPGVYAAPRHSQMCSLAANRVCRSVGFVPHSRGNSKIVNTLRTTQAGYDTKNRFLCPETPAITHKLLNYSGIGMVSRWTFMP